MLNKLIAIPVLKLGLLETSPYDPILEACRLHNLAIVIYSGNTPGSL